MFFPAARRLCRCQRRSMTGRTRKDVSILIPTHGRPRKLCACLEALAKQSADPARLEVFVGFDGEDEAGAAAARRAWAEAGGWEGSLHLVQCARAGYNA